MSFLHYKVNAGPQNTIEITLDRQANVRLMDAVNFMNYRSGRGFRSQGGRAIRSPIQFCPPRWGQWHVVVDLGGYAGQVRAGVRVL